MKRQLEIIPIQEFENIEKDSMLYVLGGTANGIVICPCNQGTLTCSPNETCGPKTCSCYPKSLVPCNANSCQHVSQD